MDIKGNFRVEWEKSPEGLQPCLMAVEEYKQRKHITCDKVYSLTFDNLSEAFTFFDNERDAAKRVSRRRRKERGLPKYLTKEEKQSEPLAHLFILQDDKFLFGI